MAKESRVGNSVGEIGNGKKETNHPIPSGHSYVEPPMVIKTADELSQEWASKELKLPRLVFWPINIYQFCIPIFVLIGIGYGFHRFYEYFHITYLYRVLILPGIIILFYAGYGWMSIKLCKWLNWWLEKESPSREGVFCRDLSKSKVPEKEIHYYHLRGFLYKWPVFFTKKSIFPWMVNYALREMSGNKIHRDALYGDCFVGLEFTELEEGVVVMEGTSLSSHVVDSIFGNLSILIIRLKKNAVLHANIIVGPGATVEPSVSIAPKVLLPKRWSQRVAASFQWGEPVPMGKGVRGPLIDIVPEEFRNAFKAKQNALAAR